MVLLQQVQVRQTIFVLCSFWIVSSAAFQTNQNWNQNYNRQHGMCMLSPKKEESTTSIYCNNPYRCSGGSDEDCNNNSSSSIRQNKREDDRRSFLKSAAVASAAIFSTTIVSEVARAGIDPSMLRSLPVENDVSGAAQRLRQIEEIQRPSSDLVDVPFERSPSGVSYREYRDGKGDAVVQTGSKVAAEMTIRCKSFATANEPGGVKYFTTKSDTEFDEIAWTVGDGTLPPGLEDAMMGMHRNSIRRIELPSTMVFSARDNNQLPQPTTKDGKRIFDRLFKTEATLLFEVLVTRIK